MGRGEVMAYYGRSKNWSHSVTRGGPTSLYYERNTPAPADPAEVARIEAVINNPVFSGLSSNKQDFIKSIHQQAANRKLTDNQINYLVSIEKSLVPSDSSWWNAEDAENIKKRAYAVAHYKATGFYHAVVAKMQADPTFMPDQHVWDKMWANKFINAGFKRHFDGARWSVGNIVQAKRGYYGFKNGIVEKVFWSYNDNNWCYEIMTFEGEKFTASEPDTKRAQGDNTRRAKKQG